jgi:hypothetical protein
VQISEEIQGDVSDFGNFGFAPPTRRRTLLRDTVFDDAKRLIKQHGSDRDTADKAASKLK